MVATRINHGVASGWFNTLAGAMKRQFATYVKTQLNSTAMSPTANIGSSSSELPTLATQEQTSPQTPPQQSAYRSSNSSNIINNSNAGKTYYYRTLSAASSSSSHTTSQSTSPTTEPLTGSASGAGVGVTGGGGGGGVAGSGFLRRYASSGGSISTPPSPHLLAGLDRRHRSPDPPPRYNRGQSPLLLRKNLLELGGGGQTPGSPMLQRR